MASAPGLIHLPTNEPGEIMKDDPRAWTPANQVGDPGEAPVAFSVPPLKYKIYVKKTNTIYIQIVYMKSREKSKSAKALGYQ